MTGMVMKLKGADSRRVIRDVRARLDEVREGLPKHVQVTPFYDQTQLIARTTKTITKNLIEGGLLVIAVLFLFLRNWRASLIVASVIPLSMLFAFGGMHLFGYGANLMSLGAMDFGLIVDASVVMIENFVRKLEEGTSEDRRSIFLGAAVEVGRPILFGIAIIVAVYIPIFTLDGMEGRMFKPMAFTVVTAVLGSLLLALTYVPSVASMVLKHDHKEKHRVLDELRARYARGLMRAMAHASASSVSQSLPWSRQSSRWDSSAPSSCQSSTRATSSSPRGACRASRWARARGSRRRPSASSSSSRKSSLW